MQNHSSIYEIKSFRPGLARGVHNVLLSEWLKLLEAGAMGKEGILAKVCYMISLSVCALCTRIALPNNHKSLRSINYEGSLDHIGTPLAIDRTS